MTTPHTPQEAPRAPQPPSTGSIQVDTIEARRIVLRGPGGTGASIVLEVGDLGSEGECASITLTDESGGTRAEVFVCGEGHAAIHLAGDEHNVRVTNQRGNDEFGFEIDGCDGLITGMLVAGGRPTVAPAEPATDDIVARLTRERDQARDLAKFLTRRYGLATWVGEVGEMVESR